VVIASALTDNRHRSGRHSRDTQKREGSCRNVLALSQKRPSLLKNSCGTTFEAL
jgi:hypothetical protein